MVAQRLTTKLSALATCVFVTSSFAYAQSGGSQTATSAPKPAPPFAKHSEIPQPAQTFSKTSAANGDPLFPQETAAASRQSYTVGLPAMLDMLTKPAPVGWDIVQAQVVTDANQLIAPYNFKISLDALREYQPLGEMAAIFSRGQRRSAIYVFRFPTPKAAYGAYSILRQGASSYVVRGDASSEDDQSVTFWQDIYVVFATTTAADDEEAKELLRKLADQVAHAIEGHARLPIPITELPYFQRVKGSEKLIMGPVGARAVVPIPYIDYLYLERSQEAAVADYKLDEPRPERLRLMAVDYGNAGLAGTAYRNYLSAFGNERLKTQGANWVLIKLAGTYLLCEQWGSKVFLISGSHNKLSPQILIQQLRY